TTPDSVTEPTSNHARLEAMVDKAKVGSSGTRFVPAVKLAGQILDASALPRRELILISDFQQAGWPKREEVSLPPRAELKPVDGGAATSPDAAVTSVTTSRNEDTTRAYVTVTARLTNVAPAERTTDAVLEIGGRSVESKRVTIPARGAAEVSFTPVPVP